MKELVKGERVALGHLGVEGPFTVHARIDLTGTDVDFSVFGLDAQGRLRDERYMVFWNQPQSPCGGLRLERAQENACTFRFDPGRLPAHIARLVVAAAIDGTTTMGQSAGGALLLTHADTQCARFMLRPDALADERALMIAELYRKDNDWRLCATAQGFNGGMAALVKHFGGTVAEPPASPCPPATTRVSFEKTVAAKAPQLVSLAKQARISLEKKRLLDTVARVALVLDFSGSMHWQYMNGRVQEVVDRVLPLAVHFDDDGSLDCWVFGERPLELPTVTLDTCSDFVASGAGGWREWRKRVGRAINNEPAVIRAVIDAFGDSRLPAYVIFISDGGVGRSKDIRRLLVESARLPIFWQFVGLGGRDYGILERLDTMDGRLVDNANFFALDDLHSVDEQELYDRLLGEFPDWLKAARAATILP